MPRCSYRAPWHLLPGAKAPDKEGGQSYYRCSLQEHGDDVDHNIQISKRKHVKRPVQGQGRPPVEEGEHKVRIVGFVSQTALDTIQNEALARKIRPGKLCGEVLEQWAEESRRGSDKKGS